VKVVLILKTFIASFALFSYNNYFDSKLFFWWDLKAFQIHHLGVLSFLAVKLSFHILLLLILMCQCLSLRNHSSGGHRVLTSYLSFTKSAVAHRLLIRVFLWSVQFTAKPNLFFISCKYSKRHIWKTSVLFSMLFLCVKSNRVSIDEHFQ
jgi:hypothetical protein